MSNTPTYGLLAWMNLCALFAAHFDKPVAGFVILFIANLYFWLKSK